MHNAIARCLPTDAQPVAEQLPPPPQPATPYELFSIMPNGVEHPFGQFGSAVPALSPPSFSCTPGPLAGRAV